MMKMAGSGSESGSISHRHGSTDPDPHQNVLDPQHCRLDCKRLEYVCFGILYQNFGKYVQICNRCDDEVQLTIFEGVLINLFSAGIEVSAPSPNSDSL